MNGIAFDYSDARPSLDVLKANGAVGVERYLAPLPNPKVIDKSEYDAIIASGLWVGLVWEWTAARATQGFAAGVADAIEANRQADLLGYPSTACIYYAVDESTSVASVSAYFQGVASVARRPVGVYGSFDIVEGILAAGLARYAWQTVAWSGGKRSARANLYQLLGSPVPGTDQNQVITPDVGQAPRPIPAPQPPPEPEDEEDMALSIVAAQGGDGTQYVTDLATFKTKIANADAWASLVWCTAAAGGKLYHQDVNNPVLVPAELLAPLPEHG